MDNSVKLEIADFLSYCDMNGEEALDSSQVERLENYIYQCNKAMSTDGIPLVADAIYDRLYEILKAVNPDSKFLKELWSDADEDEIPAEDLQSDLYKHLRKSPMQSICTCKSLDCQELMDFVKRLPDNTPFDAHVSCKENGHGIRLVYSYGYLEDATSRARRSAGHNITKQLGVILRKQGLESIPEFADIDVVEIRGEVVLPFSNLQKARQFNPDIASAFSGVSSMLRDSASEEENELLDFVAYKVLIDGQEFRTKSDEYDYLENLGFTTPLYWQIQNLTKETLLDELPDIVADCEREVVRTEENTGYDYYTDGLVFEIDDRELFYSLGGDSKYNYGNVALKVGFWKQDMLSGYVQCIMWTDGKVKYSPVAIVAEEPYLVEFEDMEEHAYIKSQKEISNWKELGVATQNGNKVRRIPLYEPNNIAILDAFVGSIIHFRYGGEAGVVPCFSDGTPLAEGRIAQMLQGDDDGWDYGD